MRRTNRRSNRGLTLPEVLTSLIVLMVLGGTVFSIYQTSIRTWRTGTLENMAQQKASWIVQRMAPDLRLAIEVDPGDAPFESNWLKIHLPSRPFDATRQMHLNELEPNPLTGVKLVGGQWIWYFRGDEDGTPSLTGTRLWRRIVAEDEETMIRQEVVADGIVDNPDDGTGVPTKMFVHWPDWNFTSSVVVTVTVEQRLGPRTAQSTMRSEVGLRNKFK